MKKTAYIAGVVWLVLAGAFFIVCCAGIVAKDGIGRLMDLMSPFNFLNYFAMVVLAAPGLILVNYGKKP